MLVQGGSDARYLPTGHLVYATRRRALRRRVLILESLTVSGGAVPLVQEIMRASECRQPGGQTMAYQRTERLVYVRGTFVTEITRTLVWVDRQGREEPVRLRRLKPTTIARISPDGTMVALDLRDQENDIWTWDLARETLTRLTFDFWRGRIPRVVARWPTDRLLVVA